MSSVLHSEVPSGRGKGREVQSADCGLVIAFAREDKVDALGMSIH